jgi:hypothetical protein
MKAFGIRPKRDLGQNFLIDSNILGVIERAAELRPDDVALEIGGGLGVLSEHLAPRCAHLHVVEIDRRLEEPLRDTPRSTRTSQASWASTDGMPYAPLPAAAANRSPTSFCTIATHVVTPGSSSIVRRIAPAAIP